MYSKIILLLSCVPFGLFGNISVDSEIANRTMKRLPNLSYNKIETLLNHIDKKPPSNLYHCLCNKIPTASAYMQYHPKSLNTSDSCKEVGDPCVQIGFGCSRRPFPKDSKAWKSCLNSSRYDDGSTVVDAIVAKAKNIRKMRAKKAKEAKRVEDERKHLNRIFSDVDKYGYKTKLYLKRLQRKGVDTSKLEKMNEIARKRIMRLKQNEELAGFMQSLGHSQKDLDDSILTDVMRRKMLKKYDENYLKMLKNAHPVDIENSLAKRLKSLGRFDTALQVQSEADIEIIKANQEITETIVTTVPVIGDAVDVINLFRGETLSGEKLSAFEGLITAAGFMAPVALTRLMKNSPSTNKSLSLMAGAFDSAKASTKKAIADKLNLTVGKCNQFMNKIKDVKSTIFKTKLQKLDVVSKKTLKRFKKSAEGIEVDKVWKKAENSSINKLENMNKILKEHGPDSKMFKSAMLEVQQDKLAQNILINGVKEYSKLPQHIIKKINIDKNSFKTLNKNMKSQIENIYKNVDNKVASELMLDKNVMKALEKHKLVDDKLNYADFKIEVKDITNADPTDIKIGRDRDVTYELVGKTSDGKPVRVDINHEVAQKHYAEQFYKELHGKSPKWKNKKEMEGFLEKFDQTVTSKAHIEAYNVDDVKKFLKKDSVVKIDKIDDVSDTFLHKSEDWLNKAKNTTNEAQQMKLYGEAMRQASKQWDSKALTRIDKYLKNSPNLVLNPTVEKSIDIFRQVENLEINPREAIEMLNDLPGDTSLGTIFKKISSNFKSIEQSAGTVHWINNP